MNVGSDGKQEIEANIVRIFFIAAIALVICYGFFDTITTITSIEDGQEDQMNKINLDFALFVAGKGYPVVQVDPDNQPYYRSGVLERGWLDATTDSERIRQWWRIWPDAATGLVTGSRTGVVRYQVELFETSVLLGFGLYHFGMYGFVAVKSLVTFTVIGGVYLVIRAYPRIAWLGIMILFGLGAIGIVAGYSNLDYFSFTIGLQSVGLDYKAVFTGISATSIITGCILSFKSCSPAVKKDRHFHEAGPEMMSEDYERYALSKYLH